MRKIFLVMLVAMFAAVSCQKSELTTQNGSGDEVTVNISAVMQSDNATTRLISDNGKASKINRCIMEIYTQEGEFYQRQMADVETDLTADFTINLVPEKTYDFVFWADHSEDGESDYHYTTTSLKEITAVYTEYDGNDESRDAFFATVNQTITASASNVEAKLYRPFGQVNVSTYVTDLIASYLPTEVQVTYTSDNIATTFNAFDGTTSGTTDFAWEDAATVIETTAVGTTLYHLSTDYIFAPASGQALINFSMEFFNNGASIMVNDKFSSIPVQRNYRTNISGELLTIGSDITVEVVPTFNTPDIEVEITTVETVAEVTNALAVVTTGENANVTITGTVSSEDENHIEVPASNENTGDTEITVNFEDVDTGATISFGGETSGTSSSYDGTVNITAPAGVTLDDLDINLPDAHIVFNGVAVDIDVASDIKTFVVAEGASVENLTVNAGNVDVYGTVNSIAQGDGNDGITEVTIYTQGKGLDYASTMVGNLANLQANTSEFNVVIINGDIQNVTTGEYYETVRAAVNAANAGDVIELAEGEYPIDILDVEYSTDPNNDGSISVVVENLTLRGVGDVTLYGNHTGEFENRPTTRSVKRQRMIHVGAQNFVMENLTLMPAKYIAYSGDTKLDAQSHTVVGLSVYNLAPDVASGFTMKDCTITPNTLSTGDCAADPNYAGMLFLGKTNNVTIDNVIFDRAKLQLDDEVATEAENSKNVVIKNCSFNGTLPANVWDNSIIPNVKLSTPLANITIENTIFSDLGNGASSIICDEGTLNLNNCTFPDENCYYSPQDDGRIFIDGVEYVIPYAMIEGDDTEYATIQAALDAADEGDVITLSAGTFNAFDCSDKNITIKGAEGVDRTDIIVNGKCEVESSSIILSNLTINGTMYVQNVGTSDNTYTVSLNSVDINGTQNSTVIDCGNINYLTFEINDCNIVGNYNSSSYNRNVFEADQRDKSTWTNDVVLIVRDSKISMIKDNTASNREFALFDFDGGSYYGLIWSEVQMLGNTVLEDVCIGSSVPAEYAMKSELWYPDESDSYLLIRDATVQLVGQVGFRMQECRLDGAGTEEDPYIVAFFDDLSLINNSVSGLKDMAGYHKQVRDIDCGGSAVTMLFSFGNNTESNYFVGTYDGGGFSIYDYKYSSSLNSSSSYNSLGLIPVLGVGGTVKNVNLVANDTDTYYFAPNRADAQFVGTIVGTCYGSVENCSSNMNIVYGENAATSVAGGIIGCLESTGSYSDITYTGTITYTDGTTSTDPIGVAVNEGN